MTEEEQSLDGSADAVQEEQRRRWGAGDYVHAEAYFARYPELLATPADALQVLYGEILLREENGEAPVLDDYVRRFPQFSEQLPLLFEVHQALESGQLLDSMASETSLELATPRNGPDTLDMHAPGNAGAPSGPWPAVAGYEILGELGRGGMGVVYKARQTGLNRVVALKMILVGSHADATQLARFRAEAELLARLKHPNIVAIHEVGAQDGCPYFSLEFVDGGSLAQKLDATPQAARPAAVFMEKLARATQAAHEMGIIHRDLKPANILLAVASGPCSVVSKEEHAKASSNSEHWLLSAVPKITDFGLAKNLHIDSGQTASGTILGTPSYMAPEQADGRSQNIGPAADVYALGTILYELLAGAPPYKADTPLATLRLVLTEEPLPLARLHVPADLVTICFKCLHKDPGKRYASAQELAEDLARFLGDRPIQARRASQVEHLWRWARRNPWLAGLSAAIVLLLATVAVVSTVSGIWLQDALAESEKNRRAVEQANADGKAKLWVSYLDQAKALRSSRKPGQRVAGLRAIQEAMRLPVAPGRSLAELRTEAIACLLLPDIEVAREWDGWPEGSKGFAIDEAFARYARGDKDGNVTVRSVADDKELYQLPGMGPLLDYGSLTLTPEGRFLALLCHGPRGFHARIWNLTGPRPEVVHDDDAWLLFRPDGRQFAAIQADGLIRLFETATGKELRRFPVGVPLTGTDWNPKFAKMALITSQDCRILDLESGELSSVIIPGSYSNPTWHPDGRILALATGLHIHLWDTDTGRQHMPPFVGHKAAGIQIKFNPTGDLLLSQDWSALWRLWDVRTGTQVLTMPSHGTTLVFSRDQGIMAADTIYPKVRLLRVHPGKEFRSLVHHANAQASPYIHMSALNADGRLLAVLVPEGVALVDIARAEEVAVLPIPGNSPLRFAAAGNALWTAGNKGVLRWPIATNAAKGVTCVGPPELMGFHNNFEGHHWGSSADHQVIAIPNLSSGALLWQRTTNQTLTLGPQEDVRFCAVSPDGRFVATGSHNSRTGAKIWDGKTGKHEADLPVGPFCYVRFSPDGRWLVTTGGGVRIWAVGTWQEGPKLGSIDLGFSFAFSADSKLLAIGDAQGVRLVTPETGREMARLISPEQTRLAPQCFTPDGTQLITVGSESGALHIFDLHAIRRQLAELGLDWAQPPFAKGMPAGPAALRIQVVSEGP